MLSYLRPAIALTLVFGGLTGLAYPLALTGFAALAVPETAQGSLLSQGGRLIGSALLAQPFTQAGYLHPRPSATDYVARGSGGSNLSPLNPALIATAAARRQAWQAENGGEAPVDAVTASGSGLDPDISPQNAAGQAARIAQARGVSAAQIAQIFAAHRQGPWLGLYGAPRVNVLAVNLALDAAFPLAPAAAQ